MCSYQLTLETHKLLSHPCLVGNGSCMAKLCRQVGGSLQFWPHQTVQKTGSNLQETRLKMGSNFQESVLSNDIASNSAHASVYKTIRGSIHVPVIRVPVMCVPVMCVPVMRVPVMRVPVMRVPVMCLSVTCLSVMCVSVMRG